MTKTHSELSKCRFHLVLHLRPMKDSGECRTCERRYGDRNGAGVPLLCINTWYMRNRDSLDAHTSALVAKPTGTVHFNIIHEQTVPTNIAYWKFSRNTHFGQDSMQKSLIREKWKNKNSNTFSNYFSETMPRCTEALLEAWATHIIISAFPNVSVITH